MKEIPGLNYREIDGSKLNIGYCRVDITPEEYPIKLTSYGQTAQKTLDPLYAKALCINDKLVICSVDLLFVPLRIHKKLQEIWDNHIILLHATHAHATPSPIDPSYQPFLEEQLDEAIDESIQNAVPATMEIGSGHCSLSMNRRRLIHAWKNLKKLKFHKTIEMRPNPAGPADHNITVLRIRRSKQPEWIYAINYACHATMWHGPSVSADWPGRINMANAETMFLQGFCGNVIPYYARERNNWKDKIIALVEGTKDFRKKQTTERDMEHAASLVRKSVYAITEYHQV